MSVAIDPENLNATIVAIKWRNCWTDDDFAKHNPDQTIEMLRALKPKDLEQSKEVCCRVESFLYSANTAIRSAAIELFYTTEFAPRVSMEKRLESIIPAEIEFIVEFED